jgi:hypothetical protein
MGPMIIMILHGNAMNNDHPGKIKKQSLVRLLFLSGYIPVRATSIYPICLHTGAGYASRVN